MITNSIRWRLQIWLAVLLTGLLGAFCVVSWQLEKTHRVRRLDEELSKRAAALGVGIRGGKESPSFGRMPPPRFGSGRPDDGPWGPPDGGPRRPPPSREWSKKEFDGFPDERMRPWFGDEPPGRPTNPVPADVAAMFPGEAGEDYYYAVWTGRSDRLSKSDNAPEDIGIPGAEGRDTQTKFRDRGAYREAFHFTERGECVLAGRPVAADLTGMKPFTLRLSLTGLAVFAVGLGGGWWLTSRSMRPIEDIASAARRISDGNLSERIPATSPGSELHELATVLNNTFSKLEDSFAQQKRFTSDASHELRTPLAVLIAETQSALSRERSPEEYREALTGNLDTARQMKRLAESLLELARLDAGDATAAGEPLDLANTARETLSRLKPLASSRSVTLAQELLSAPCIGSEDRVALVIMNLVENAIHHGRHGGTVTVRAWQKDGRSHVSVADDGPGIPVADLPHIFDRFYRADKSRNASGGRYGLGLAICKGMVEAGRGTIAVESRSNRGTTFTVSFPSSVESGT
ncbi:ATP-binding protein [Luteolibacter sp. GHJ8]|uniref:histidine kinase n=1 Tax=Luteolibacter rhizosphaerae TaxID=2989719 RepID=A0ABT3G7C9_9BACT|nr:ATP-binding protein [Luteolibacter rhizosphaerae]MCW1915758.1 ATP-binding protein [Luteolibacter rhizosphaerae]